MPTGRPFGGPFRPTTVKPGVRPLGSVRRSQLVSTYGIGAIIDLEKGSFMPMGLEDWESATRLPTLTIGESRLQAQLGVDHFRLPPITESIQGTDGRVEANQSIPAIRFPAWHECPTCHRIGTEGEPFRTGADDPSLRCFEHSQPSVVTPVRFVVACRKGHIDEFPWVWWAHKRKSDDICDRPVLELRSRGKSAALADLYVRCRTCNQFESLGGAFHGGNMSGRHCGGFRPWLHDRVSGCDAEPQAIQRGASNAHFSVVASALSIPPVSEASYQIVENQWPTLSALPTEAVQVVMGSLASKYGVPTPSLMASYQEKLRREQGGGDRTDADSRSEEYAALSSDRDDPSYGGVKPQFRNSVSIPAGDLSKWFDLVGAVSRLREVRALTGFTRIEPYPIAAERVAAAIEEGHVAPLSKTPRNWLPAAEILGEGLFLRFRTEAVDSWIAANPAIAQRAASMEARAAGIAADRGYPRDYRITPRLLLVHSFSHALIRTISINCGYSSSAIRERLYVREADESVPPMNGVLIYTGSPDSEGSLGGLVRLAEENQLRKLVLQTVTSAGWCGSDPVCLETDPKQSGDRISGAACHCCLLLPETSCEKFNRELDRTALVGSAELEGEIGWNGFFDSSTD